MFIGPSSDVLAQMGDKLSAKDIAIACGVPIIPGCTEPLKDGDEALEKAISYRLPRHPEGRRRRRRPRHAPLRQRRRRSSPPSSWYNSEAKKAFGNDDIFMEKYLVEPKHIEVQILADRVRQRLCIWASATAPCSAAIRRWWSSPRLVRAPGDGARPSARATRSRSPSPWAMSTPVPWSSWWTRTGNYYFIEMNPRIQVEHTVTEMVTGIDLVRAQMLIAAGLAPVLTRSIGLTSRRTCTMNGYAIQCRVTTEDPTNNFAPDNGKITAYRSGGGFGVRLDGGNAGAGTVISPYYDSLLVKVTSLGQHLRRPSASKAARAISEVHIRGVKTNIPFVTNILAHPAFIERSVPHQVHRRDAGAV